MIYSTADDSKFARGGGERKVMVLSQIHWFPEKTNNRWNQVCNPIKLKEYLALGKPIISTPFTELQKYRDVVYVAKSPEDFAKCIKKALAEDGPERVAARRSKVKNVSWESKAEQVMNELFGNLCDN